MMDFTDFDRMFSAYQKNVDQVGFTKAVFLYGRTLSR